MVIMVIVVIKKNYFGGAWSFELMGTPNLIGLPGYGGLVVMVVILIFKKKL